MNIKEFFKRDNLDEMQKQTLLKIESRGFWVLWVLLLAALIIESLLGFAPREMAAEWFIFMLGCAYSVLSDLRAGIWDRHLKANTKTNAAVSVVGGVAVFVWGLIKFAEFGMGVAVLQAVIMGKAIGRVRKMQQGIRLIGYVSESLVLMQEIKQLPTVL